MWKFLTRIFYGEILKKLYRLEVRIMALQDDVDAKVARLNVATASIQAGIDFLKSQSVSVDLTGLEAAVSASEAQAASVTPPTP